MHINQLTEKTNLSPNTGSSLKRDRKNHSSYFTNGSTWAISVAVKRQSHIVITEYDSFAVRHSRPIYFPVYSDSLLGIRDTRKSPSQS